MAIPHTAHSVVGEVTGASGALEHFSGSSPRADWFKDGSGLASITVDIEPDACRDRSVTSDSLDSLFFTIPLSSTVSFS